MAAADVGVVVSAHPTRLPRSLAKGRTSGYKAVIRLYSVVLALFMTVPSMTCCKQPTPVNMHSWHKRSLVHFFFRERTETRSETWMKAWPRILCILFKHAGLQTSKPGRRDCNHVGEEACSAASLKVLQKSFGAQALQESFGSPAGLLQQLLCYAHLVWKLYLSPCSAHSEPGFYRLIDSDLSNLCPRSDLSPFWCSPSIATNPSLTPTYLNKGGGGGREVRQSLQKTTKKGT